MRRLAWALLPFCTAVFLAVYLIPDDWHLTVGIACFLLSSAGLFCRGRWRVRVLLTMLSLCLGFVWCSVYQMIWCTPARAYIGEVRSFTACVIDYPKETDYGVSVTVQIQSETGRPFRACLYLNEDYDPLTLGDEITGTGSFTTAEVIHDREVSYYTAQGIHVLGKKIKLKQVKHQGHLPWTLYPLKLAHWIQGNLDILYGGDMGGLLKALITGEKSGMSDGFRNALSRAGLSHMTAVSGMHMVFLVEFVLLLPGNRRWKSLAAIPLMFGFALLTGVAPSVVRAAVMETILLLGVLLRRQYDAMTALSAALFVILVQNPWAAGSIGLQLSFASVLGIHLILPKLLSDWHEPVTDSWGKRCFQRCLWNARQAMALTISAMAFTVPLTVLYFDQVSVIAPLSNLLVVWSVSLLMAGGMLTALLYGVLPIVATVLAWPVKALAWYVVTVVKGMAALPFAALDGDVAWIRLWLVATYILLLLACRWRPKRWKLAIPAGGTLCILVLALIANRMTTLSGTLTTAVLDVGQGQCVALISDEQAIAVDCGGSEDYAAGDELADYLTQLGIFKLKLLVLTHYDSDHTNGVAELLERISVDTIAIPDEEDDSGNRVQIEETAQEHGVVLEMMTTDERKTFGTAQAQVFAPVGKEGDNGTCLSVLASAGSFDVLVTGDMDSQVEEALIQREHISQVEVLVVGHHGSRYSTSMSFLDAITPEVSVISVGRDNSYGHPTQDVLDRLEKAGVTIYRTDLNGTVIINDE